MIIGVRLCLLAALFAGSITTLAACELTDVEVAITKTWWHNRCSKQNCAELKGTAVLTSRCDEALDVQIRLSGLDASGKPIIQRELWPYALSNVRAGEHPFSLDKWFQHDAEIKSFRIGAIQVRPVAR